MIVELLLKEEPKLDIKGYEKIEVPGGLIFSNPIEGRIEIVVKKHPDGRTSVFTDKSEVIKTITQSGIVVDVHPQ